MVADEEANTGSKSFWLKTDFSIAHTSVVNRQNAARCLWQGTIISFIPLILGIIGSGIVGNIEENFKRFIFSGELYFYAISYCGSIFVLVSETKHLSLKNVRSWSSLFIITCIAFMSFYVGQKTNVIMGSDNIHVYVSALFFATSLFIYYRVLVLAEEPPVLPDVELRRAASVIASQSDTRYE